MALFAFYVPTSRIKGTCAVNYLLGFSSFCGFDIMQSMFLENNSLTFLIFFIPQPHLCCIFAESNK